MLVPTLQLRAAILVLMPLLAITTKSLTKPRRAASTAPHNAVGEVLHYRMTGDNDGWHYVAYAEDTTRQDADGHYFEDLRWTSDALLGGTAVMHQTVSLDDPARYMVIPNLSAVPPRMIGPITDTLTFYSDLLLAMRAGLNKPGQHSYIPGHGANSWADGRYIVLGEDAVDFDMTVVSTQPQQHTRMLEVRHVPPVALSVHLPAAWMHAAVSGPPNNFVQVQHTADGYVADAGHETFDVRLTVDTLDDRLLNATMHNPVEISERTCSDAKLTHCSPAVAKTILREIRFELQP